MRKIHLLALLQLTFLAACGGSGGGSLSTGGTGGTGGSGQTIASAAPNVVTMTVDAGPAGLGANTTFNIPYISVTICVPGSTTNCQTIDHIEVDTGSYGLRVISSVLNPAIFSGLPQEATSANVPIVECTQFGDGFSWGSMRLADISISGEKAASVPMQVMGDPNYPTIPTPCSNTGPEEDTVAQFGANGILGVGPFVQDCGPPCTSSTQYGLYYACPTGGGACSPTFVLLSQEAANPVATFTTDNNGVIMELPSVPDAGAITAKGALVFGIGTEGNNALGSATVLTTDTSGEISVTYNNVSYPTSFIDSGSNLNFIDPGSVTVCGTSPNQLLCPSSEISTSATAVGLNGTQSTVKFNIGDSTTLFNNNPSFTAFNNVAAPSSDPLKKTFDFGLPFFYGHNVFTAIEGMNTAGGMGPYFAY
ncbi:MAG TPA: DUF3443 domain-containing protein [Steroidobacteraceae bacterium]|nr:DUF3443 domain-containing protein [Steroidobacteraceae bacterium]